MANSWKLSWIVVVALLPSQALLGPRFSREIYPEIEDETQVCIVGDVAYGPGDAIPAEQSCLRCKCLPPKVECESIICEKKKGCKAIQLASKCCPEYQCECDYDGVRFDNGEKIPSGDDCKVCYCRGGEVQCTAVTCYTRDDCEGKLVPGQCCPKYDNCPVWPISNLLTNKTKITIHEIIHETKEIPVTDLPRSENQTQDNGFNTLEDGEVEASEISEVFQAPPSVLRIGDKLLFLYEGDNDTSTSSPVITIIGAEGLERGFEETSSEEPAFNQTNDELQTSESTHILSLVKKKNAPTTTTTDEPILTTNSTEETTPEMAASSERDQNDSRETLELASTENASVESSETPEAADMLTISELQLDDVEIFKNVTPRKNESVGGEDVEMIDVVPEKIIKKREAEEVFRQLADELAREGVERVLSEEEDKVESERIFKELLAETRTPRTRTKDDKDAEMIERITDAIARVTLGSRKGPPDFNLIRLIGNFLGPRPQQ